MAAVLESVDAGPGGPSAALGRRGEDLAARHLARQGHVVLVRNWRCPEGELDLVATDGAVLVICEVKTRSTDEFGPPAAYVTPAKALRVRRATLAWLRERGLTGVPVRYDVVAIVWPEGARPHLDHLRSAF